MIIILTSKEPGGPKVIFANNEYPDFPVISWHCINRLTEYIVTKAIKHINRVPDYYWYW